MTRRNLQTAEELDRKLREIAPKGRSTIGTPGYRWEASSPKQFAFWLARLKTLADRVVPTKSPTGRRAQRFEFDVEEHVLPGSITARIDPSRVGTVERSTWTATTWEADRRLVWDLLDVQHNPRGAATPAVLRELLAVAGDAAEELGSPLAGLLHALAEEPDIDTVREYAHGVETEEFQTLAEGLAREALEAAAGDFETADFDRAVEPALERAEADDLVHLIAQSPAVKPARPGDKGDFRVRYPFMSRPVAFTAVLLALARTTLYNAVLGEAGDTVGWIARSHR